MVREDRNEKWCWIGRIRVWSAMTILYALVARGAVVLAEFSAASSNANTIARRILEKLPASGDNRVSYSQDRHIFHILRVDGLTFLCMATDSFGSKQHTPPLLSFRTIITPLPIAFCESPVPTENRFNLAIYVVLFYSQAQ